MEASLAGLEPAVLAALCRLGVPDHLSTRTTVEELAAAARGCARTGAVG